MGVPGRRARALEDVAFVTLGLRALLGLLGATVALASLAPPAQAEPLVVIEPQASGPAGQPVRVVGLGFDGGQVELRWNSTEGERLAATVGPDFTTSMVVPSGSAGFNTVVAVSRDANGRIGTAASAGFLVTAADEASRTARPLAGAPGLPAAPTATPTVVWVALAAGIIGTAWVLWRGRARTGVSRRTPDEAS